MTGIALVFLIPIAVILLLMVLALCKVAGRSDEAMENIERPKVEVLNPPGPRYM